MNRDQESDANGKATHNSLSVLLPFLSDSSELVDNQCLPVSTDAHNAIDRPPLPVQSYSHEPVKLNQIRAHFPYATFFHGWLFYRGGWILFYGSIPHQRRRKPLYGYLPSYHGRIPLDGRLFSNGGWIPFRDWIPVCHHVTAPDMHNAATSSLSHQYIQVEINTIRSTSHHLMASVKVYPSLYSPGYTETEGHVIFPYSTLPHGWFPSQTNWILFHDWVHYHANWIPWHGWIPLNGWLFCWYRGWTPIHAWIPVSRYALTLDIGDVDLSRGPIDARARFKIIPNGAFSLLSHRWIRRENGKITSVVNPTSPRLMGPVNIYPRRLINTFSLELVEFEENETVPQYAILSHRWKRDEEVVYQEYIHRKTSLKSGYRKIEAACHKAREDGIYYIWIDTCCIKQGNHDDVAANIKSMYPFYQNAVVCYVYLDDVADGASFKHSNWFSRGWTLQELLAPRTVLFFNEHWSLIGNKHQLKEDIQWRTRIPLQVLSGERSVQDVDILDRMSWGLWRTTSKPQDEAYCLQGLVGVSIEPNYDEHPWTSFNRLGKALLDANPELERTLGIRAEQLSDAPQGYFFRKLILDRLPMLDQRTLQAVLRSDSTFMNEANETGVLSRQDKEKKSIKIRIQRER